VERLGFDKVECEIRKCVISLPGLSHSTLHSDSEPNFDTADDQGRSQVVLSRSIVKEEIDLELSEYTGTPISTIQNGHEGTQGLYLRINGKTYALTCRHVVDQSPPAHLDNGKYGISYITSGIDVIRPANSIWNDRCGKRAVLDREPLVDRDDPSRQAKSRIIGSVFLCPSCPMKNDDPPSWVHDWALIQLNEEAFENGTEALQNRVYVGDMAERFSKPLSLVDGGRWYMTPESPSCPASSISTDT
jgi:hypothetical protein